MCRINKRFKLGSETYDAFALFEYFNTTGDNRDPISRREVEGDVMKRLETAVHRSFTVQRNAFEEEIERRAMVQYLSDELLQWTEQSDNFLMIVRDLSSITTTDEWRMINELYAKTQNEIFA